MYNDVEVDVTVGEGGVIQITLTNYASAERDFEIITTDQVESLGTIDEGGLKARKSRLPAA